MLDTATVLRKAADIVTYFGLHTGDRFASEDDGRLSITAAIYRAVTNNTPNAFLTDDDAALDLIRANPDVTEAVRYLSACLPLEPPIDDATGGPDHIEHIERYAAERALHGTTPPTEGEVVGRILRAADACDVLEGHAPAA